MTERQRAFELIGWGGERDGAGRPKKAGAKLRHAPRDRLASRFPAHVTLRTLPGTPNLRRSAAYGAIDAALRATVTEHDDFRVVHFSVQTNHVHLLVEANGPQALSRGMQGLGIRIARGVNRAAGRSGKLWADRFHARILRSPREVRLALCYVLRNTRRHATAGREIVDPSWIDGWRRVPEGFAAPSVQAPTGESRTWLLSGGWRRAGLIGVDEVPSAAFA